MHEVKINFTISLIDDIDRAAAETCYPFESEGLIGCSSLSRSGFVESSTTEQPFLKTQSVSVSVCVGTG